LENAGFRHKLSTGERGDWGPATPAFRPAAGVRVAGSRRRGCCNLPRLRFPGRSVCAAHASSGMVCSRSPYLVRRGVAVRAGEADAVGGVGDVEVEHGPDGSEAPGLGGEAADHLGPPLDRARRPLERGRSPSTADPGHVAQVDRERVEVVGQPSGRNGVAGVPLRQSLRRSCGFLVCSGRRASTVGNRSAGAPAWRSGGLGCSTRRPPPRGRRRRASVGPARPVAGARAGSVGWVLAAG
jgi:hypothetical protein